MKLGKDPGAEVELDDRLLLIIGLDKLVIIDNVLGNKLEVSAGTGIIGEDARSEFNSSVNIVVRYCAAVPFEPFIIL